MSQPEGLKFDTDKPPFELLDAYALEQISLVLKFGAAKYATHNWRKGIVMSRLLGACLRHVFAYLAGNDNDEETGLSHLAHAGCCILFALWTAKYKPELDDRYKEATHPGENIAPNQSTDV